MIRELSSEEAYKVNGAGTCGVKQHFMLPDRLGIFDGGIRITYTGDPTPQVVSYIPPEVQPAAPLQVQSVVWQSASSMAHELFMNDKIANEYGYSYVAAKYLTVFDLST
jgi:hypothetical protein